MNKKTMMSNGIMGLVMLVSHWIIGDIVVKYFSQWSQEMGVLAFVFRITIVLLIGALCALLTEKKMISEDEFLQEAEEIEIKDERNIMIRSKSGLFMWRVNFFLLVAFMLFMIAMQFTVAAWSVIVLMGVNIAGYIIRFEIENRK